MVDGQTLVEGLTIDHHLSWHKHSAEEWQKIEKVRCSDGTVRVGVRVVRKRDGALGEGSLREPKGAQGEDKESHDK